MTMKKATIFITVLCLAMSLCVMPAAAIEPTDFKAKAALLMEAETGKILFEKEKDVQLSIASITKLMVLLITMEEIDAGKLTFQDYVKGSPKAKAAGGSTMFLDVGEEMTVDDVLKGVCIASANDGAIALAEKISGSEEDFVVRMNERAQQLGLKNTHYVNATGFDAGKHYSSAYDVAVLSCELVVNHPLILQYSGIQEDWLRGKKTQLLNTNKLLYRYQYTTGLKTGTETNAKYCVSATADKDGMKLVSVILGAPDDTTRFSEAKKLLEYGYDSFEIAHPVEANEVGGEVAVKKGAKPVISAIVQSNRTLVVPKTYSDKIKKEVVLDETVKAPLAAGTKIGEMKLIVAGDLTETIDLVAAEDVGKVTFWQSVGMLIKSIFSV